jgi:hypothetical protein
VAAMFLLAPASAQEAEDVLRDTLTETATENTATEIADVGTAEGAMPIALPDTATLQIETLRRQQQPPKSPLGLGKGPVKLFLRSESGLTYASNPDRTPGRSTSDVAFRQSARIIADADWSRHDAVLDAGMEIIEFAEQGSASTRNADAALTARLDIRRSTFADLDLDYGYSDSEETDSQTEGRLVEHTLSASAGLTQDFGPLRASASLRLVRFFVEDGTAANGSEINNSDLAYVEPVVSIRTTAFPEANIRPFTEVSVGMRLHDQRINRFGERRDSRDLTARAGAEFGDGAVWESSIAAVVAWRKFDEPGLKDEANMGVSGDVVWKPRTFVTVTLEADSGLRSESDPGEAAIPFWLLGASTELEISDHLSLEATASLLSEKTGGNLDYTSQISLGTAWRINDFSAFNFRGEYEWFEGAEPNSDYSDARLIASLILQR